MTHTYRIAERCIQIRSVYSYVHEYCADYRVDADAEWSVVTTREDIAFEREKSRREDIAEGRPVRDYSDAYLETLAVYRKIAERMPLYQTFLFHGSVVAVDGEGYLFTAKSGVGKSTHTKYWMELFGNRAVMINDDKPLIRVAEGVATVYGTPYNGKHRRGSNLSVPLKAVCMLERAERNRIEPISKAAAFPQMVRQIYRPSEPEALSLTLMLLDRMTECVGLYRLECNMSTEAAKIAYRAMKG